MDCFRLCEIKTEILLSKNARRRATVASWPRSPFHALLRGPELAGRVRRLDLLCRRGARAQNRRAEIVAERRQHLEARSKRHVENAATRHNATASTASRCMTLSTAARVAGGFENAPARAVTTTARLTNRHR
jgi:hypothetical protein